MMQRGGFDGVNAALMVHPGAHRARPDAVSRREPLRRPLHGQGSARLGLPGPGVNAADAITVAQVAIGLLRQHSRPNDQVHGIVTYGGAAPNIVPALAVAKFYVRAETLEALKVWEPRVMRCFEAGALATGASLEVVPKASRTPSSSPTSRWRRSTARTPRRSAASSPPGRTYPERPRPTWATSRSPSPRSTRCSGSTRFRRSTISPSSPPPPRARRPIVPCSTAPWRWRGRRSTSPATRLSEHALERDRLPAL